MQNPSPLRGFSTAEFEARTARAQAAMDAAKLDALLVSTPQNVRYFSGLGMQLTEPPSHRPGDGTVITPGMVLTIEPGMEYAPGKMIVHEENIAVTRDGPVLLTKRAPRELPVIR
jgi:Xaa-Pro aminopeptidase